jgi:hypothetical protein
MAGCSGGKSTEPFIAGGFSVNQRKAPYPNIGYLKRVSFVTF